VKNPAVNTASKDGKYLSVESVSAEERECITEDGSTSGRSRKPSWMFRFCLFDENSRIEFDVVGMTVEMQQRLRLYWILGDGIE
jgi:hypothetical protein